MIQSVFRLYDMNTFCYCLSETFGGTCSEAVCGSFRAHKRGPFVISGHNSYVPNCEPSVLVYLPYSKDFVYNTICVQVIQLTSSEFSLNRSSNAHAYKSKSTGCKRQFGFQLGPKFGSYWDFDFEVWSENMFKWNSMFSKFKDSVRIHLSVHPLDDPRVNKPK